MKRKKTKLAMREEIVKYIFPTTYPKIAQGVDGFIVYDFDKLYPHKLGIFIPNEVDQSNYSAVFPRPFESYFANMNDKAEFLSRLLEVKITPSLKPDLGIECMSGKVLEPIQSDYTIFRFDELVGARKRTDVLCRVDMANLTATDRIEILADNSGFIAEASAPYGTDYFYWIESVNQLFRIDDETLASIFELADNLQLANGPF